MAKVIKAAVITAVTVGLSIVLVNVGLGAMGLALIEGIKAKMLYAFVGTLVAGGIGQLTNKGIEASADNLGKKVATTGIAVPRQIVYGLARVGGTIVKMDSRGNNNAVLSMAVVVAGHEIEGFTKVFVNNKELTTSSATLHNETVFTATNSDFTNTDNDSNFGSGALIRFTFHKGDQTAVDGLATQENSSRYPTTCKLLGCAYFYMEFVYDPEKMPSLPELFFLVKGKNVFDPRTNALANSDLQRSNPALQVRDFISDTTYGLKALDAEINDGATNGSDVGSFCHAANICDANLTTDGVTETTYTSNGFFNFSSAGGGVIQAISSACAGNLTYTNGQFNFFAGATQTASLIVTDEKVLGTPQVSTKSASGELFNSVKSVFVDSGNNFNVSETPLFEDATMLTEDTPDGANANAAAKQHFKKTLEMRFPMTTSQTMAQRLQKISLLDQRQTTTINLTTTTEFLKAQPNDHINVTNERLGFTNKLFKIEEMSLGFFDNDGTVYAGVELSLRETSPSIFTFGAYQTPQDNSADPVIGVPTCPIPTNGTPSQVKGQEGPTTKINIKVPWTNANDPKVLGTEVQYKLSGDSTYQTAAVATKGQTEASISNVTVGETYNIKLRHFTKDNVYSDLTTQMNVTVTQPDSGPDAPTSISATTDKPLMIEVEWTNPSNVNLRAVEVHVSTTSGFTPSSSTLIGTYIGDVGKKKTIILGVAHGLAFDTIQYIRLRSINVYGTASSYTSEVQGKMLKVANTDISVNNLAAISANLGTVTAGSLASNLITGDVSEVYPLMRSVSTSVSTSFTDHFTFSIPAPTNGIAKRQKIDSTIVFRIANEGQDTPNAKTFISVRCMKKSKGVNAVSVGSVAAVDNSTSFTQIIEIAGNVLNVVDISGGVATTNNASGTNEPANIRDVFYDAATNRTFIGIEASGIVFSASDSVFYSDSKFTSSGTFTVTLVDQIYFQITPPDPDDTLGRQSIFFPYKGTFGTTTTATEFKIQSKRTNLQSSCSLDINQIFGTLENIS
ncbi:MAG: hypothetical protein CMC82_04920 [Flavobacteriaceae bacterium]|nr:hypothetical protein [Flavobacteriaceae bacterium]|tara:strand:- start:2111 stop:5161 length:3051 start_codon:yes stop_codon:yes gene_type:complete